MTPLPQRPATGRRLSPEDRKAELLDAAAATIRATASLEATTLERVAEAAGCSRNLVYRYFGDHRGLIDALASRLRDELLTGIAALPAGMSAREWLHSVTAVLLDQAAEHGHLLLLLFERPGGQLDQPRRQLIVTVLVERLVADGVPERRARVVAPILGAAIVGSLGAALNGEPHSAVLREVDHLLDAFLS